MAGESPSRHLCPRLQVGAAEPDCDVANEALDTVLPPSMFKTGRSKRNAEETRFRKTDFETFPDKIVQIRSSQTVSISSYKLL